MPVSKKPRKTQSKPDTQPIIVPNHVVTESLFAAMRGQSGEDAISKAQEIMYDAWEQSTQESRIALARKALEVSPLCADAYVLLAEESANSPQEARDLFAKGVEAGELAIGPEDFEEYQGNFWGFLETRPYMRARAGLAGVLLELGDMQAAIGHYRDMLKLNPGDNQGVRYTLLACLLKQDDPVQINNLLDTYPDEWSAFWLYTRLLVAFRAGKQGKKQTAALIKDAMSANEHVPAILVGRKRPTRSNSGYITVGGADEATDYVAQCGAVWKRTPGAVEWLASAALSSPQQRRASSKTK
jgi:tetratricopeptide (TPR) repeat protein